MGEYFKELLAVNVNEHTEKKSGLTYLSWPYAWAEVKKRYPDATYSVKTFDSLPYIYDSRTGYMVFTTVRIGGDVHEMWLPVMDANNKAMKDHPYEYTTKAGKRHVDAATMYDVNKTIMRCLVKNLAMFGLGLYIYAGEDLPITDEEPEEPKKAAPKAEKKAEEAVPILTRDEELQLVKAHYTGGKMTALFEAYKVGSFDELSDEQVRKAYLAAMKKRRAKA